MSSERWMGSGARLSLGQCWRVAVVVVVVFVRARARARVCVCLVVVVGLPA